jgi:uncharacterized protein (DUF924 family)
MPSDDNIATATQVLTFWFGELTPAQWWRKDVALDRVIAERFATTLAAAKAAELADWRDTARGRLAEVIVLDQFSRNVFRDRAESFAADGMALALAQEAVRAGLDRQLPVSERAFFYLPYMHSESAMIHQDALRLFDQPGLESNLDFERRHYAIIARFGRYPHRNAILGRASSAAEIEFLQQPGSSF